MQTTDNQYFNPSPFAKQGCKQGAKKVQKECKPPFMESGGGVVELVYNPLSKEFEATDENAVQTSFKNRFFVGRESPTSAWVFWKYVFLRVVPVAVGLWVVAVLLYALPAAAFACAAAIKPLLIWAIKLAVCATIAYFIVISVYNALNGDGVLDNTTTAADMEEYATGRNRVKFDKNGSYIGHQRGNINVNIQINNNEF